MSERERSLEEVLRELRAEYNAPRETPREEMWQVVRAGLPEPRTARVVELASRRPPAPGRRLAALAVAAAALVVLGVGIGRMSAPTPQGGPTAGFARAAAPTPLRTAAVEHLEGSEALLSVVRADARSGELDPQLRTLAKGLLTQTRLLLDASEADSELRPLLEDLELVLAQLVTVTEDGGRSRTELELALDGLDDREVLTRIRTLSGAGLAGT